MLVDYVPLLERQRELYRIPRGRERFNAYLETMIGPSGEPELMPLVLINPMAREHVSEYLDALIAAQADRAAAEALASAAGRVQSSEGPFRASVVVGDNVAGGWTNRWAYEAGMRLGGFDRKRPWITGLLWCSEPPTVASVVESILAALFRADETLLHGPPRTLRELMRREGLIMVRSGTSRRPLDPDEAEYTREVIRPYLDQVDLRTAVECLFGDTAARTLGFTALGLSPWAGLDLALTEASEQVSA